MDTRLISIIVAVADHSVIGRNGDTPWHLKGDMNHFRDVTRGHSVIMGRKTAEAIMRAMKKPLPHRRNMLVTRNRDYTLPGFEIFHSFKDAIRAAMNDDEIFVIGGAEVYKSALPYANRLYLTRVHADVPGDAFFPDPKMDEWEIVSGPIGYSNNADNDFEFSITVLQRKKNSVVVDHAKSEVYAATLERIKGRNECPFCENNLAKEHGNPILREGRFWKVTENQFSYPEAKLKFILIYRQHAEKLSELDPSSGAEMIEMAQWLEKEYKIPSGAMAMRFGDPQLNGSSVYHLHFHLIVPYGPDEPEFNEVKFRMSAHKRHL